MLLDVYIVISYALENNQYVIILIMSTKQQQTKNETNNNINTKPKNKIHQN